MSHKFDLSLASIANRLKDQLFKCNEFYENEQDSFAFFFEVSANYYGYAEDGNTKIHEESSRRVGGMILYTGNTKCWGLSSTDLTVGPAYALKCPKPSNLRNILSKAEFLSGHDSCWCDAVEQYFRRLEKNMLDEVVAHVPENERDAARNRASLFVWNMGEMFAHVTCDYERREVTFGKFKENQWFPVSITFKE